MKRLLTKIILFALFLAISSPSYASIVSLQDRIGRIINRSEGNNEIIGIQVVSLNRGDTLYSHNSVKPLNPASCTKLITTAAALKLLGPDFKFQTKFFTDVRPQNGKVGKLWVKGYGDPSIVIERLWRIARDIANTGLKEITGDIVIDDYNFDGYKYPGYIPNSGRAYNSLTGAVSLNFNTVTVVVAPASRLGAPPHVAPDTAGPYFHVRNMAKTGSRGSKKTITISRIEKNGEDIIIVKGSIPVESPPIKIYRNITNPPIYFGLALKSLLQQNGIKVGGKVYRALSPGGGYPLLDSRSKPLSLIIHDMNKYSNNFIAEQIVKTLAYQLGSIPGTTAKGIQVIANYLSHLGIPPDQYHIVNGSGLTRENRISSSVLTTVLAHLYADYKISPEAISSLSIAGVDGTIKDRHKSDRLKGLARAKTGTLSGVSTLVGVIPALNGEMLGYAILMNGNGLTWGQSHNVQEEILTALTAFRR